MILLNTRINNKGGSRMKLSIRDFLIICGAILFSFSVVTEVFSAPRRGPRHSPGKPRPHKVSPKHRVPAYKKRIYVIAPLAVKPTPPTSKHIWVPRYRHPSGTYIGGCWRPATKSNLIWVPGHYSSSGVWIKAHWK